METFNAKEFAGEVKLNLRDGTSVVLGIEVLDYLLWQDYEKELQAHQKQMEKLESSSDDKERANAAVGNMKFMLKQLNMLMPDLEDHMLEGMSLNEMRRLLEYCVSIASGAERDEDEKKPESGEPSKISALPGKASRGRRSKRAAR